jgi:glutaconate CoA-transferase, subunit B
VTAVITDLGVLEPDPETCELTLTSLHPSVELEAAQAGTGWELQVGADVRAGEAPTTAELDALRSFQTLSEENAT